MSPMLLFSLTLALLALVTLGVLVGALVYVLASALVALAGLLVDAFWWAVGKL